METKIPTCINGKKTFFGSFRSRSASSETLPEPGVELGTFLALPEVPTSDFFSATTLLGVDKTFPEFLRNCAIENHCAAWSLGHWAPESGQHSGRIWMHKGKTFVRLPKLRIATKVPWKAFLDTMIFFSKWINAKPCFPKDLHCSAYKSTIDNL